MAILSSIYTLLSSLLSPNANLEHEGQVLETKAVPGLMTVLDIALQRSVEYELTGTLTTSHSVFAALLDVKRQAKIVIDLIRKEGLPEQRHAQSALQSNKVVVESFARTCLDAACDVVQVLSTDRLATTANLSDPYENTNNNTQQQQQLSSSSHDTVEAETPELSPSPLSESAIQAAAAAAAETVGLTPSLMSSHSDSPNTKENRSSSERSSDGTTDDWWKALNNSVNDTGRRVPAAQRPRDLWETARLHCVDYLWGEEVMQTAQRVLRHIVKHPLVSEVNHHQTQANAYGAARGVYAPTLTSFSKYAQDEIMILLQLIQVDLPVRLLQFRAALENEAVVLKHLYLLKCECRAPFRAFLEAHQSVLKAPRFSTVQDYEVATSRKEDRKRLTKDKLQKLLETPELVDCLSLEQTSQHLEIEISKALYPFCELARYLDHKRASVRHADMPTSVELQILLHRLKGLLARKSSGHDSSAGIRPLLLDLQRVPREDELNNHGQLSIISFPDEWKTQVERLIQQLELLNEFCRTRGSFRSDKKVDVEAPTVVVERCASLDVELFRCHCLDWYTVVEQQQQIDCDWDDLAEEIRQAELEVSLATVATTESVKLLSQRLRVLEKDREKRFSFLAESLEEFGRRELNLLIKLEPPEPREVLALRPTSAKGVFGIPLEMAGETLPVG